MNKAQALDIAITAMFREILREDDLGFPPVSLIPKDASERDRPPEPRFDFDESGDVCEHGGVWIDRATCPIHSDEAKEYVPTAEELDDLVSEEDPGMLQRAARLRQQRERVASVGPLFPEDLPMKGMGPPADLP